MCVSQGELLKRHEQLNHDYVDLRNRSDVHLVELDRLRNNLQNEMQANGGLNKRLALLDNAHSSCPDRERELMDRLKDMEKERDDWIHTASDQVEKIRSLEETLAPKSRQLVTAEEGIWALENEKAYLETRLAQAYVDHQQLVWKFIPTVIATMLSETRDLDIEVADSYHLLIADLMKVSPDVPPSPTNETGTYITEETVAEATFGTTT
ncbi:hypothetical protein Tco_0282096 [Tanacetum coccineum]